MPTLTLCRGLPASGKSTWAKAQVEKNPHGTVRVNNDDLRDTFNGGVSGKNNEKQVGAIRDTAVKTYLSNGYNVILDNTNLSPIHEETWKSYCKENGLKFVIKNFDTSVEECIERDSKRDKPVGEEVIRRMYQEYVKPQKKQEFEPLKMNIELAHCVICDIDGTIAKMTGRIPYDYSRVSEDIPHKDIIQLITMLDEVGLKVIFVSGRSDSCRKSTVEWLNLFTPFCNLGDDRLYMRKDGDLRRDDIIKYEILRDHIIPNYYVKYWIDDRDRVVKAIREAGVRVLQVAEGSF